MLTVVIVISVLINIQWIYTHVSTKSCQFNPRDVGEPHSRLDDEVFLQKKSTVMNENLVQFIK